MPMSGRRVVAVGLEGQLERAHRVGAVELLEKQLAPRGVDLDVVGRERDGFVEVFLGVFEAGPARGPLGRRAE